MGNNNNIPKNSGKSPAFQFYPSDWMRDLEEHPLEIEGAWIRICCKLWWSETPGTATKTLSQWAKVLRVHHNKAKVILNYLAFTGIGKSGVTGEGKGIGNVEFLDNQNITITSRRMVRDYRLSLIRKEVGKLGGNPKLKKPPHVLVKQNPTPSSSTSFKRKINKKKDNVSLTKPNEEPALLELSQEQIQEREKKRQDMLAAMKKAQEECQKQNP